VKIQDPSKIKSVYAYYKLMPASYEWLRIEMLPTGDGNYAADVPLTAEGVLYYFEAVDERRECRQPSKLFGADSLFRD